MIRSFMMGNSKGEALAISPKLPRYDPCAKEYLLEGHMVQMLTPYDELLNESRKNADARHLQQKLLQPVVS